MKHSFKIITITSIILLCAVIAGGIWIILANNPKTERVNSEADNQRSTYSLAEVATHNTLDDCWTVIDKGVYDLTDFVNRHPGGAEITRACGIDATSLFNERQTAGGQAVGSGTPHSAVAKEQLETLKIGTIE